jgi:basic amino acid/polyamine antiporter, APA family
MDAGSQLVRAIGRWSLVALMLNSVIGSGIFGQPTIVAGLVGAASPLAYLAAAAGMGVIMACFAEVASRFRQAGGPYLYARAAFGRLVGIEIAWLTWLVRLSGAAAGANLFVNYLSEFWPSASQAVPRLAVLTLLVGVLAAVNYCGVRAGARLSNFFTVAKLLPLLAFAGVGLFFIHPSYFQVRPAAGPGRWLDATLVSIYAFGGFEGALIPMSESKNPGRDAPFALLTSLAVVAFLYILIQVVVVGVLPEAARTDRPLAEAARRFMGSSGSGFIALGALVSVYGYLSAMMLNVPRLTFALGEREDFPPVFAAVHPRFRTPHISILTFALLTWALAAAGSFRWNLILSALGRLFTYASTCAALLALRKKHPGEESFRLPAGPVFALLGFAFSVVLVTRMGRAELLVLSITISIAFLNWLWARQRRAQ